MLEFSKSLLKTFSDKSEKIRETSVRIVQELISRCEDMTTFLPYIFSILIERSNCDDLEGIANLPDVMKPAPTQKPFVMRNLIETSEYVRIELQELLGIIITCADQEVQNCYINEVVDILRTYLMDPVSSIQIRACKITAEFVSIYKEMLFNFGQILGRALQLPLCSKKSPVIIAALEAMREVLYCGTWKFSVFVMEVLTGFKDPNTVAIREFYEPGHNYNYLALLINNDNINVREAFQRVVGDWMTTLPDRYDHEARLIPYLLSGLFDRVKEIQDSALEVLDEVGISIEREKEKEFREEKQFGVHPGWSKDGALFDLPLPPPFKKRPRMGVRYLVKNKLSILVHPITRELKDNVNLDAKLKATQLLLVTIAITEDQVTAHQDKMLPLLIFSMNCHEGGKLEQQIRENICKVLGLIGRFCPYTMFGPIIEPILKQEIKEGDQVMRDGLIALEALFEGYLSATVPKQGLQEKTQVVLKIFDIVGNEDWLSFVGSGSVSELRHFIVCLYKLMMTHATSAEMTDIVMTKKNEILRIFLACQGLRGYNSICEEGKDINEKEIALHITEGFLIDEFDELFCKVEGVFLSENKNYLESWVNNLDIEKMHKTHCDFVALIGLMFFAIQKSRQELFRQSQVIFYSIVNGNKHYMRFTQNLSVVLLKNIEDKLPQQKRKTLYEDIWPIFTGIVGWGLKYYYSELYLEENKDIKKVQNLFLRRVQLLSKYFVNNIMSKKSIPNCHSQGTESTVVFDNTKDLFMYLNGLIILEKDKVMLFKWLQAAGNMLNGNKKFFEERLFDFSIDIKEDITAVKRLDKLHDESKFLVLRLFTAIVDQFQALDATQVDSFQDLMKIVKPIFEIIPDESGNGSVTATNGLEEKFLGYCEILITVGINERNKEAVDMIKVQLIAICKKFCISFSKLLQKAEKTDQPARLMFLRQIWEKALA